TTSLVAIANFLHLIDRYAVNLLFNDQWDLYAILATRPGTWALFRWQWGPHRQGLGFLVTRFVAEQTAWNVRVESFVVGAIVIAALPLALVLRRRLLGPFTIADAVIPLIVLTTAQHQTLLL